MRGKELVNWIYDRCQKGEKFLGKKVIVQCKTNSGCYAQYALADVQLTSEIGNYLFD